MTMSKSPLVARGALETSLRDDSFPLMPATSAQLDSFEAMSRRRRAFSARCAYCDGSGAAPF